jgi:carboxylate-amine ligase
MLAAGIRSRTIESFHDLHWDIRPHGDLGTLEIRVFDAQIDARRVAEIAALVRSLVVVAGEAKMADSAFPARLPHWMELENHFRACKSGLDADIITTPEGETEPLMQIVEQLFDLARNTCERLGDSELLADLERTLITRNGARQQQRVWQRQHSCNAVARFLVDSLRGVATLRATA